MNHVLSQLFEVRELDNAGRGVIARQDIPIDTVLLESDPPAFHVILKEYAKETCATCFLWNRGKALPVRDHDVAKCFCSADCQAQWRQETGELGITAWQSLTTFVRARGKGTNADDVMSERPRPDPSDIDGTWTDTEAQAKVLRHFRDPLHAIAKADRKLVNIIQRNMAKVVDIDVLSYLLSGALYRYSYPTKWDQEILALAMDNRPYRSHKDLEISCLSYLQLISILPQDLLPRVTAQLCRTMVNADNHNAFGIRAGEDSEEYMGYAVYPSASYFNHSCSPNVNKLRVGHSWIFSAARDIDAGEECCITYLGGDEKDMNVTERRSRLKEVWDFDCGCTRCVAESSTWS